MSSKSRFIAAGALALALAGSLAGATAASASTARPALPPPVAVPWQFDAQQSTIGTIFPVNVNAVVATRPIAFSFGRVSNPLPTLSIFRQGLFNSVRVIHTPLAAPVIDLNICVATVDQTGVFRLAGGSGRYLGATGSGRFHLQVMASFQKRGLFCPLSLLTVAQVQQGLNFPRSGILPRPVLETRVLQGAGLVRR